MLRIALHSIFVSILMDSAISREIPANLTWHVAEDEAEINHVFEVIPCKYLTCRDKIKFNEYVESPLPGSPLSYLGYDDFVFGEKFRGMGVEPGVPWDLTPGAPTNPLTIDAGEVDASLSLVTINGQNTVCGVGGEKWPNNFAIGLGAIALKFDTPQTEFGFTIATFKDVVSVIITLYDEEANFVDQFEYRKDLDVGDIGVSTAFKSKDGSTVSGFVINNAFGDGLCINKFRYCAS